MDSMMEHGSVGVNNLRHSIYVGVFWKSVGLLIVFGASSIILWIELVCLRCYCSIEIPPVTRPLVRDIFSAA